jgi:predicted enzyme related to lactoylglutathione lyase
MATVTQHAPGTFCWVELATIDAAGAKKFYTSLFGWAHTDSDMGNGELYTMFHLKGASVGALYAMRDDERKMAPPHWNSYVAVESADDAAARAKQLGGRLILEPFDVMDAGRMAVVMDPQGAVFQLWQAKKHIGAGILGESGALCWNELMTTDTQGAEKFYSGLFPWRPESMPMSNGAPYTVFKRGDVGACGMMAIAPEMGPVPPNWMPYFAVDDCDASVARALSLGGKGIVPATDIPNTGRFAVLQDPQGAVFSIIRLAPM